MPIISPRRSWQLELQHPLYSPNLILVDRLWKLPLFNLFFFFIMALSFFAPRLFFRGP